MTGFVLLLLVASLVRPVTYHAVRFAGRPRAVDPVPPTPDLWNDPPAIVNLLVHQDRVTTDAVEGTLLDLAARGVLEVWSADGYQQQTAVVVRQADAAGLTRYEQLVLRRVVERAADGPVPVGALAFADRAQARAWWADFQEAVAREAWSSVPRAADRDRPRRRGSRHEGLLDRSVGLVGAVFLLASAFLYPLLLTAALIVLAVGLDGEGERSLRKAAGLGLAFMTFGVVVLIVHAVRASVRLLGRWRLSDVGREHAAHWLGVRDWLRGFPTFAELPPAAVEVWDRYLAYGAALGVTSVTGVIDLGLQRGGYAWSGYGGRLRRVRVPGRRLAAIGGPVSLAQIVVGLGEVGLIVAWIVIASHVGAGRAALAIGPVMLALPLVYLPVAGLLNVGRPAELVGEVVWANDLCVAVDDGASDTARPWLVESARKFDVHPGDTVLLSRRRGGRCGMAVLHRGRIPVRAAAEEGFGFQLAMSVGGMVCDDEVGRLLGRPVRSVATVLTVTYLSTVDGTELLRIELRDEGAGLSHTPLAWTVLTGDGVSAGPGWARVRRGPQVLAATAGPPVPAQAPAEVLRLLLSRLDGRRESGVSGTR